MTTEWMNVQEFFYSAPRPSQYGFLPYRDDSRPEPGKKAAAPPKLQRSNSNISDHDDKTVDLEVPICCEACGARLMDTLIDLPGIKAVTMDYNEGKVTLRGEISPKEALAIVKKIKPKATHRVRAKKVTYNKPTAPPAAKSKK